VRPTEGSTRRRCRSIRLPVRHLSGAMAPLPLNPAAGPPSLRCDGQNREMGGVRGRHPPPLLLNPAAGPPSLRCDGQNREMGGVRGRILDESVRAWQAASSHNGEDVGGCVTAAQSIGTSPMGEAAHLGRVVRRRSK
jgi:hypothetical protein